MTTAIEYALLAGAAYYDNRADIHRFPLPSKDWSVLSRLPEDKLTGFEVSTFTKGSQAVISFAGTDFSQPGADFLHGNFPLAAGIVSDQLKQAAKYYLQMKALYPAPGQITLTGHSLGGGIAALIGVFFGETTFTFDQAPFKATALKGATTLRDYLASEGYDATSLGALNKFITDQTANGGIPNEGLVTNMNVQGEIVSASSFARIGNETSIPHGTPFNVLDIPFAINLHSQSLLTAFLQSNELSPNQKTLHEVSFKFNDLLQMIFDEKLFARPVDTKNTKEENFLEHPQDGVRSCINASQ